jgi:hypothetical protein
MLYNPKRTNRIIFQEFDNFIEQIIFEKFTMRSNEFEQNRDVMALILQRKIN